LDLKFLKHSRGILGSIIFVGLLVFPALVSAATGDIQVHEKHQTIEGFGASVAWYEGWLTNHPNRSEIYDFIFCDLGLDILRLRNNWRYNSNNFAPDFAKIVDQSKELSDHKVKILISSWSPPADLKSNNSTEKGGTLIKEDGQFAYAAFADYWAESLDAFEGIGITADYISIQNEPGFTADWESCVLKEKESADYAGYDKALDAVYNRLQVLEAPPKILGPEVLGIGYNLMQNYAKYYNHDQLYGYAHHLYHGGDSNSPDAFNTAMRAIAKSFSDKPIFQTEYDQGGWFQTAWIMHNALVTEGVSGYCYWNLIWPGNALVNIENPWSSGSWTTPEGYILTEAYYAFRQYSKYIYPGWQRVGATVDDTNLRISAYTNTGGDSLVVVVLNVSTSAETDLALSTGDFVTAGGLLMRTTETEFGEEVGNYTNSPFNLPARSITTLVLTGETKPSSVKEEVTPAGFVLLQNYPNPFNPATTINYTLPVRSHVQLSVYNVMGQEVAQLINEVQNAGNHNVSFEAADLQSGVYLCKIQAGDYTNTVKMLLVK